MRFASLSALLVAVLFQAAVTIAAIVKGAVIIGMALSAAMLLLAFALLLSGIRQSRNAILDLVDHPLVQSRISCLREKLGAALPGSDIVIRLSPEPFVLPG